MMIAPPSRCTSLMASLVVLAGLSATVSPRASAEPMRLAQQDQDYQGGEDNGGEGSALLLRVTRLENEIRTLRGRVDELQHQNEQLQDTLRKFSQDVDFRFQDLQGRGGSPAQSRPAQRRGDAAPSTGNSATPSVAAATTSTDDALASSGPAPSASRARRGDDAFNPASDPNAPGAPQPLGTTPPSRPLGGRSASAANAPLDLMHTPAASPPPISDAGPNIIAAPDAARSAPDANAVASLAPGGTRDEFDTDVSLFKQGRYDAAATGLQSFLDKYPRDRMVPDAVYMLGESYSRLGRHREAAEQYLKLSTDYGRSPRAPDALLRLGMSLDALGAKEQACATFQEVTRKYPAASAEVKSGVDRELKRSHCRAAG